MATKKPSLYFLTTELPWPATSGGRIKTYRLLKFLSQHYDVRLACAHGANDRNTLTELREASGIASVQVFGELRSRNALNWFMAIAQFPTLNCYRVYSKKLESVMRWGIEQAEVTIVDHLEMMEMIPENLISKVIYHSHNAEFRLWADYAKIETNPIKKWVLDWEADRVKVFERWAIKRTAFTFAAPNDQASIMDANKLDANKFRLTYHLGDESLLEKPTIDLKGNKPRVLFMGTLSWMPNKDGINWYIDHVWPQVVSKMPSAELIICGKGADSNLVNKAANTKGVSYLGFVEDLNAVMETCKAAIIPLRFGSGMKIKTLDAMYRGLPVLSSNGGIGGLDVEHDNHALICQNDEEWVQQTISVLNEESKMQAMADRARALVRDKYVYPQIFRSMLGDMQQTFPSDVS